MDNYDEKGIPRANKRADETLREQAVRFGEFSCKLITYKTIDSTNDEAKRMIAASPAPGDIPFGTVIIAGGQTAGRGRLGRVFASPEADSVYMSFILRPAGTVTDTLLMTIMSAVAVCEAIEAIAGDEPRIKWVNDIYIDNKKVCGILAEGVSASGSGTIDGIALGIGVNINVPQNDFPEEIRGIAGSVRMNPRDRCRFTTELIERVNAGHDKLSRGIYTMDAYRERSLIIGREITVVKVDGTETAAVAERIADDGSLLVKYENGRSEHLNSGEVSLKI